MDRNTVLIHLFEKMGVPLINAISAVELWKQAEGDQKETPKIVPAETAKNLAALLNQTVSLSTALAQKLELPPTEDQTHRLDLASVATLVIAHHYALKAAVPEDNDINIIAKSLESVLSFADYFSNETKTGDQDSATSLISCLDAIIPLIQSTARFSFGQNEKTFLNNVLNQLGEKSNTLFNALKQDNQDLDLTAHKMRVFKGAAQLFTLCYEAEMNALAMQEDIQKQPLTDAAFNEVLDKIWTRFDTQADLLRTVLGYINNSFLPGHTSITPKEQNSNNQAEEAPSKPKEKEETPSPASFSPIQAILQKNSTEDPQGGDEDDDDDDDEDGEENADDTETGDNGNPMSFFTKK